MVLLNAQAYMLPCLNKKLFGIACPGCGMQRALYLLSKGELTAAFHRYPGIYPLGVLLLFSLISLFVKVPYARIIKLVLLGITTGTIIVSYVLKMAHVMHKL